jgi:hypothetical protein
LEWLKAFFVIPGLILGILFGLKFLILGIVLHSLIAFILNSLYSGRFLDYSLIEQICDILPSILISSSIGLIVYLVGYFLDLEAWKELVVQLFASFFISYFTLEFFALKPYLEIKNIIKGYLYLIVKYLHLNYFR